MVKKVSLEGPTLKKEKNKIKLVCFPVEVPDQDPIVRNARVRELDPGPHWIPDPGAAQVERAHVQKGDDVADRGGAGHRKQDQVDGDYRYDFTQVLPTHEVVKSGCVIASA